MPLTDNDTTPARSSHMRQMPTEGTGVTLINLFTVDPKNQQRLVEFLADATEVTVSRTPGFISAKLHRSIDGSKVTMYAQRRNIEDYQAMREDPAILPRFQEALRIAKFDPGIYQVVRTLMQSE